MAEILDLEKMFPGPATLDGFPGELSRVDFAPYAGKHVQLKGCLPSWAHLMVAGKLFSIASQIDFVVDDGKSGIPLQVYKK